MPLCMSQLNFSSLAVVTEKKYTVLRVSTTKHYSVNAAQPNILNAREYRGILNARDYRGVSGKSGPLRLVPGA